MDESSNQNDLSKMSELLTIAMTKIEELQTEIEQQKKINIRTQEESKRYMSERNAYESMCNSIIDKLQKAANEK